MHWKLQLPYKMAKSIFSSMLVAVLDEETSYVAVRTALEYLARCALVASESGKSSITSCLLRNNLLDYTDSQKRNLESEYCRLETFKKFPKSKNPLATPINLAKSGLYYQPSGLEIEDDSDEEDSIGEDRCVCFTCSSRFAGWDSLQIDPW
jgi:hypothetical protein